MCHDGKFAPVSSGDPGISLPSGRDAAHCECSRQSVLYILEQLLPERHITVRTVETVLGGGTCCRFAVTVE